MVRFEGARLPWEHAEPAGRIRMNGESWSAQDTVIVRCRGRTQTMNSTLRSGRMDLEDLGGERIIFFDQSGRSSPWRDAPLFLQLVLESNFGALEGDTPRTGNEPKAEWQRVYVRRR